MGLDLDSVVASVVGQRVPRPAGPGAISGHAAGEPFDKLVQEHVDAQFSGRTFRHFELLNAVLLAHPDAESGDQRKALLGPPALRSLLSRGVEAMNGWTPRDLFVEKQSDTADIVVRDDGSLDLARGTTHLLDVKTYAIEKAGQPPNIISARKVASMCATMIDTGNFGSHDLSYFGLAWEEEDGFLIARKCSAVELFKEHPKSLYINWAAATQIQFHIHSCDQEFEGDVASWCREFLRHFVESARRRIRKEESDFIRPYEPYLD